VPEPVSGGSVYGESWTMGDDSTVGKGELSGLPLCNYFNQAFVDGVMKRQVVSTTVDE